MSLLYEKIADILRTRIDGNIYAIGAKIPSEADLSLELNVSRPTVKSAVRLLEKEGLLSCRAAVGSDVKKKSGEQLLIGYLTPDLSDPYHSEFIGELSKYLKTHNGNLVISELSGKGKEKDDIFRLLDAGIKGVVFFPFPDTVLTCKNINVPMVTYGYLPKGGRGDIVSIDNKLGVKLILEHLRNVGVKTVGYAGGYEHAEKDDIRRQIFLDLISPAGLTTKAEWNRCVNINGEEGGKLLFEGFINSGKLPEAIVCYNDWNAIGLVKTALENSVDIPGQLKVTGFDNLLISEYFKVPVTTIDCDIPSLARESVDMLVKRQQGYIGKVETVCVKPRLIVRESTGGNHQTII